MNEAKKAALAAIDEKKDLIAQVADAVWDYAELSMQEVKSAALFVKVLKAEGFIEIDRRHGAKVCTRQDFGGEYKEKVEAELELLITETSLKGMKKEEFMKKCEEIYNRQQLAFE